MNWQLSMGLDFKGTVLYISLWNGCQLWWLKVINEMLGRVHPSRGCLWPFCPVHPESIRNTFTDEFLWKNLGRRATRQSQELTQTHEFHYNRNIFGDGQAQIFKFDKTNISLSLWAFQWTSTLTISFKVSHRTLTTGQFELLILPGLSKCQI